MNTIYGIRSILEAIDSKTNIDKVWLLKGQKNSIAKSLEYKLKKNNKSFARYGLLYKHAINYRG